MTDKELRKLTRAELLEVLLVQSKEIDRLNTELTQLNEQLTRREIALERSGNIAEAALQLSGIFEAAQAAADQYLANVLNREDDTEDRCRRIEEESRRKCEAMLEQTGKQAKRIWETIRAELYNPRLTYEQWQQIAEFIDAQLRLDKP